MSRKRSSVVCQSCHDRKVRCNLAQSGPPCVNCSLDELICQPRPRKAQRVATSVPQPWKRVSSPNRRHEDGPGLACSPTQSSGTMSVPELTGTLTSGTPVPQLQDIEARATAGRVANGNPTPYLPLNSHFSHHEHSQPLPANTNTAQTPIYGDPRGITFVADICEPERRNKSGHFFLHTAPVPSLSPEDLDYISSKGGFSLPAPPVSDLLVRAYFHHVHPFFPVIEAKSFLGIYESSDRGNLSPHLLWSMFLAASNFLDEDVVVQAGFSSRREMRRSTYLRAKAFYDVEYERDRITLIQAVLLMGFWFADTEDRAGPWHWIGVAISLCQTVGLHRKPDAITRAVSANRERQWRQIWWACVFRDTWFSVGMGRPMRISLDDCDTPMPGVGDFDELLSGIPTNVREKYLPDETGDLSRLWVDLLRLTVELANVLSVHYRVERTKLSRTEIEDVERKIRACFQSKNCLGSDCSRTVLLHVYHLELYLESVVLVLYRPCLLESPQDASAGPKEWRSIVGRNTQAIAASINRILENLIISDMLGICQAIICIALVPAMQVHLLNCASAKPLLQRVGRHNLDLCMIVVEELRKTYFGAEILYKMFSYAQKRIQDRRTEEEASEKQQDYQLLAAEEPVASGPDDGGRDAWPLPLFPWTGLDSFFGVDELAPFGLDFGT